MGSEPSSPPASGKSSATEGSSEIGFVSAVSIGIGGMVGAGFEHDTDASEKRSKRGS